MIVAEGVANLAAEHRADDAGDPESSEHQAVIHAQILHSIIVSRSGRKEREDRAVAKPGKSRAEDQKGGRGVVDKGKHVHGLRGKGENHGVGPANPIREEPADDAPERVKDGQYRHRRVAQFVDVRLVFGDEGHLGDDHQAGRGRQHEHEPELVELPGLEHLVPIQIGAGRRRLGRSRSRDGRSSRRVASGRICQELGQKGDEDNRPYAEDHEGAGDAGSFQQILRQRRDIDGGQPHPADHKAGDEALLGGWEPFDRGRGRRGIAQADANAADQAEGDQHHLRRLCERRGDQPQPEDDAAEHRHVTRADLVLPAPGEDHHERERCRRDRERQRSLGRFPMPLEDQGLAHHAPGVQHAENKVYADGRDDHGPPANWGSSWLSHMSWFIKRL